MKRNKKKGKGRNKDIKSNILLLYKGRCSETQLKRERK